MIEKKIENVCSSYVFTYVAKMEGKMYFSIICTKGFVIFNSSSLRFLLIPLFNSGKYLMSKNRCSVIFCCNNIGLSHGEAV